MCDNHCGYVKMNEPISLKLLLGCNKHTNITPNQNELNTYLFSETDLLHTMINI